MPTELEHPVSLSGEALRVGPIHDLLPSTQFGRTIQLVLFIKMITLHT